MLGKMEEIFNEVKTVEGEVSNACWIKNVGLVQP